MSGRSDPLTPSSEHGELASRPDTTSPYLEARRREGRLLTAREAARLPGRAPRAARASEWAARRDSCRRLIRHLRQRSPDGKILELGCGVGWLTALLARELDRPVVGVDLEDRELETARQAFGADSRIRFERADVFAEAIPGAPFETVVMAASLQYFPDPARLFARLTGSITPRGDILVLDTPIYRQRDLQSARERTRAYYRDLGVPEMAGYYFHHDWASLDACGAKILHRPRPLLLRLSRRVGVERSPFPFLRIPVHETTPTASSLSNPT